MRRLDGGGVSCRPRILGKCRGQRDRGGGHDRNRRRGVFTHEQVRVGELLRRKLGIGDEYFGAEFAHRIQAHCEIVRHANAAVRRRMAQIHALMQGHARPSDVLHEGHGRRAIDVGLAKELLLNDAERADRRRMLWNAGCHQCFGDFFAVAVKVQLLLVDEDKNLHRPFRDIAERQLCSRCDGRPVCRADSGPDLGDRTACHTDFGPDLGRRWRCRKKWAGQKCEHTPQAAPAPMRIARRRDGDKTIPLAR